MSWTGNFLEGPSVACVILRALSVQQLARCAVPMRSRFLAMFVYAVIAWTIVAVNPGHGAIAPQEYRDIGISPPANAMFPPDAVVTDEAGHRRNLGDLISRPAVLVFADYTCSTLCGPIVAFVASALERSGLRAGEQFQLIVIGLDPKDNALAAA